MRVLRVALGAALSLGAVQAAAVEPKPIAAAGDVKKGLGAVRLSVQAQAQQLGTLHVWFLRVGGDPARKEDVLEIERKVGVPLAGVNMVDSKPRIYALKPGRYRLLAHGVKCGTLPPEGTTGCSVTHYNSYETPARRYGERAPEFEVVAGKLTDAGEFILETPPGTPIVEGEAIKIAQKQPHLFAIRVRPSTKPVEGPFRALPAAPPVQVPAEFVSAIRCPARPKGAMMYLPFDC